MKKLFAILLAFVLIFSFAACGGSGGQQAAAPAEKFPTKDITMIVPYAAGGSIDIMARAMQSKLSEVLGVNIVIQNVEGGGGGIGTSQALNSAPDGYTITFTASSAYVINSMINNVGFTYQDSTPICIVTELESCLAVAANSDYKTFQDLIDSDGPKTFATPGANCAAHLAISGIALTEGKEWNHAPNGSTPQMLAELVGGHIDFAANNIPSFKANVEDGSVRILAVSGDKRDANYPDVPTYKELGYEYPGSVYFCIAAPKGVDPEVAQILSDAFEETLKDATVVDSLNKVNYPPVFLNTKDFSNRIGKDADGYKAVLKSIGVLQ